MSFVEITRERDQFCWGDGLTKTNRLCAVTRRTGGGVRIIMGGAQKEEFFKKCFFPFVIVVHVGFSWADDGIVHRNSW